MSHALRAFLAHPKDTEDATIDRLVAAATEALKAQIEAHHGTVHPVVISGRDDFNDRVMACGGWAGWSASVVDGTGYIDGALRSLYDLIIVSPSSIVGKATADMVERALILGAAKKPVFFMPDPEADDGGKLYPVTGILLRDAKNFKKSHTLRFLQPI